MDRTAIFGVVEKVFEPVDHSSEVRVRLACRVDGPDFSGRVANRPRPREGVRRTSRDGGRSYNPSSLAVARGSAETD